LSAGLALLAWIIARDGPAVVPLYEKLERELAAMRAKPRKRACALKEGSRFLPISLVLDGPV
jgi:hypothetical protein